MKIPHWQMILIKIKEEGILTDELIDLNISEKQMYNIIHVFEDKGIITRKIQNKYKLIKLTDKGKKLADIVNQLIETEILIGLK